MSRVYSHSKDDFFADSLRYCISTHQRSPIKILQSARLFRPPKGSGSQSTTPPQMNREQRLPNPPAQIKVIAHRTFFFDRHQNTVKTARNSEPNTFHEIVGKRPNETPLFIAPTRNNRESSLESKSAKKRETPKKMKDACGLRTVLLSLGNKRNRRWISQKTLDRNFMAILI